MNRSPRYRPGDYVLATSGNRYRVRYCINGLSGYLYSLALGKNKHEHFATYECFLKPADPPRSGALL